MIGSPVRRAKSATARDAATGMPKKLT